MVAALARGWKIVVGVACCLIAISGTTAGMAHARGGSLDQSFGGGRPILLGGASGPAQLATGSDGSVAVLREGRVKRFLPSGAPDRAFGDKGSIVVRPALEGLEVSASDIALDRRGRLIVFGTANDPDEVVEPFFMSSVPVSWAVVLRYTADGSLDPSFGNGKGYTRSDFGLPKELSTDRPTTKILAGELDSRDRPVLLLGVAAAEVPCEGHSHLEWVPRAMARLTVDGQIDPSFGGGGGVAYLRDKPTPVSLALGLTARNQPIATFGTRGCRGLVLYRFRSDGTALTGFGGAGRRVIDGPDIAAFGRFGESILRVGRPTKSVLRIKPNGERDLGFGVNGVANIKLPAGASRTLHPIGVDSNGGIILLGSFSRRGYGYLYLKRLRASGIEDGTFGRSGKVLLPLGRDRTMAIEQTQIDQKDRVLVVYSTVQPQQSAARSFLARFLLR